MIAKIMHRCIVTKTTLFLKDSINFDLPIFSFNSLESTTDVFPELQIEMYNAMVFYFKWKLLNIFLLNF